MIILGLVENSNSALIHHKYCVGNILVSYLLSEVCYNRPRVIFNQLINALRHHLRLSDFNKIKRGIYGQNLKNHARRKIANKSWNGSRVISTEAISKNGRSKSVINALQALRLMRRWERRIDQSAFGEITHWRPASGSIAFGPIFR